MRQLMVLVPVMLVTGAWLEPSPLTSRLGTPCHGPGGAPSLSVTLTHVGFQGVSELFIRAWCPRRADRPLTVDSRIALSRFEITFDGVELTQTSHSPVPSEDVVGWVVEAKPNVRHVATAGVRIGGHAGKSARWSGEFSARSVGVVPYPSFRADNMAVPSVGAFGYAYAWSRLGFVDHYGLNASGTFANLGRHEVWNRVLSPRLSLSGLAASSQSIWIIGGDLLSEKLTLIQLDPITLAERRRLPGRPSGVGYSAQLVGSGQRLAIRWIRDGATPVIELAAVNTATGKVARPIEISERDHMVGFTKGALWTLREYQDGTPLVVTRRNSATMAVTGRRSLGSRWRFAGLDRTGVWFTRKRPGEFLRISDRLGAQIVTMHASTLESRSCVDAWIAGTIESGGLAIPAIIGVDSRTFAPVAYGLNGGWVADSDADRSSYSLALRRAIQPTCSDHLAAVSPARHT